MNDLTKIDGADIATKDAALAARVRTSDAKIRKYRNRAKGDNAAVNALKASASPAANEAIHKFISGMDTSLKNESAETKNNGAVVVNNYTRTLQDKDNELVEELLNNDGLMVEVQLRKDAVAIKKMMKILPHHLHHLHHLRHLHLLLWWRVHLLLIPLHRL
jgi:hypothetical protein